jgi:hypothetical protein
MYYRRLLQNETIELLKMINKWFTITTYNYKKGLVSRINPSLLLKIYLLNTWTLQLSNINQIKSN